MKVAITGGTGFVGRYVVEELLDRGLEVLVLTTSPDRVQQFHWRDKVIVIKADINLSISNEVLNQLNGIQKLIHLAWSGLPNYNNPIHFEKYLMPQYYFLKSIIEFGICDITISGTCFEYGKREGCITSDMLTNPNTYYGLAKDTLHKLLVLLQKNETFVLKWIRLFYLFGEGQAENTIVGSLNAAINNGHQTFNMSLGKQMRDYLSVQDAAKKLVNQAILVNDNCTVNCCSGIPISIESLVEKFVKQNNAKIELNKGYYPYNVYEPMSFWGHNDCD
ncbi:MAG: NAD(P)-dependent oxidoreductase [Saprospiraceae bacterium]|uniref:NAD(P)-dependent oxidoreductase n=1 Tax=Candidatus Defluviibacterium haderslevense TaxID=2981993 RepID=A0A9D7SC44_9BACT|nr:NAD(P)-dependent oxidoreductase [Candidatus Defluviibacterium haderslevense]